ncbi:class I SAM-dependent methyltransferase [Halomonas dongshanensis]|uniref:Class I SAM-dependent methyltransferase n=1 Tax=Halomonas dongshanensis TaxID=2890835 RepID=A0ABT2EDX6_9GAMM|nr:class I SAM-dependent methyltransferase [Halomonas dongshanensis]MCS2609558.1 class I SAM-dependent methyltransferase [Halomonas dongshanensis]
MKTNTDTGWEAFYQANQTRTASPLLRRALGAECLPMGNRCAIDLGCGGGIETAMLLHAGWRVVAIDKELDAIKRVNMLKASLPHTALTIIMSRFETLDSLPTSALIHAGLSLPFCESNHFSTLWTLIQSALEPGGLFVGHLFGTRHDWAGNQAMTFHTKEEVEALCDGVEIELFRDSEGDGGLVPHHWHRFDLILRKPMV